MDFRTFNSSDWHGFGGACNIAEGRPPLICDNLEDTIVVIAGDPTGNDTGGQIMAEVFFNNPDDGSTRSYISFFTSVDEARGYLLATHDLFRLTPNTLDDLPRKWMRVQ